MRNTDYTELFNDISQNHKKIGNNDNKNHFARIVLNQDPLSGIYLEEYLASISNSDTKYPLLLLISYDFTYTENNSNNRTKNLDGSFIIFDQVTDLGSYDEIDTVFNDTEQIGEDIIAYLKALNDRNNLNSGWFHITETSGEHIGPIADNFFGTKFYFTIHEYANAALKYNEDNWNEPIE